jgi:hypothetical protein
MKPELGIQYRERLENQDSNPANMTCNGIRENTLSFGMKLSALMRQSRLLSGKNPSSIETIRYGFFSRQVRLRMTGEAGSGWQGMDELNNRRLTPLITEVINSCRLSGLHPA